MAVTWADVVAVEPLALNVDVIAQNLFLSTAALLVDVDEWGGLYDKGILFMAAHLGLLAGWSLSGSGAAGPVTSETLGPMSRSYADKFNSQGRSKLETTKWGQMFLMLQDTQSGMFVA